MKNGNKSNEANAHYKNNVRRDLESRCIVCVKLEHGPTRSASSSAASCPSPAKISCSCCCCSSLGCSSTCCHFCNPTFQDSEQKQEPKCYIPKKRFFFPHKSRSCAFAYW
ncbi:hypothetical protein MIMGU_mgv1a016737mg [Erythranthe guttata]|uniref:Uncharacterized protein n=1 Tax=Erythranthe guttata TaxID=4155 RepID=A0A022RQW0_ERYGU|nr:hypothetical protein MIMGU_mgv1a016737mg [Erythranthe guttata]